jgi:hypothetical protein
MYEDSLDTSQRTQVPPTKRPVINLCVTSQSIFFVRAVWEIDNTLCGLKADFLVNLVLYIVATKF